MNTLNLDQYLETVEFAPEVLEGLKNIQFVKKEIIENTPKSLSPTINEKFESMIGRIERMEVLEYVIYLQEDCYSKNEILKMEDDFEYMTKEDIDSLIGYVFKERTFYFNALGAKRANS